MIARFFSSSPQDTRLAGKSCGQAVNGPFAFLLTGDYGTGKTTFVQGLAEGLGVAELVRSPSYNIIKTYQGAAGQLVHADLYRTHGRAEIDELGLMEFLAPDGILAMEWPGEYSPPVNDIQTLHIHFSFVEEEQEGPSAANLRLLEFDIPGDCQREVREVILALAPG